MDVRWLVVGLGNPGPQYAETRHNVGARCVARLARGHGIDLRARRLYSLGEGEVAGVPVALARPRLFMNESGRAVALLLQHLGLEPPQLLVVCDDLDLPLGRLRLRPGGGHGGHNGLRSIIEAIGTTAFPRLRIGIGRPTCEGQPVTDPEVVAAYVLAVPPPHERALLEEAVGRACQAVETVLRQGLEAAMNLYNR